MENYSDGSLFMVFSFKLPRVTSNIFAPIVVLYHSYVLQNIEHVFIKLHTGVPKFPLINASVS